MLKNKQNQLQGLIIIALSSCLYPVHAADTVSSYEQSRLAQDKPVSDANYNLEQLSVELEKRGWKVAKEKDGSMILKPQMPTKKNMGKTSSSGDQWQQVKEKFNNAGWDVVRDNDGSIRLYSQAETSKPENTEAAVTTANTAISLKKDNLLSADMQTQLETMGWGISKSSDGSLSLYPPAKKKISPEPCHGTIGTINIDLPVNTWQEAHDIASQWVQANSISNDSVGKIRKIVNIYIISIVSATPPHALLHQVALRTDNGAVILLN